MVPAPAGVIRLFLPRLLDLGSPPILHRVMERVDTTTVPPGIVDVVVVGDSRFGVFADGTLIKIGR